MNKEDNVMELPKKPVPWNTYFTLVDPDTGELKAYLPVQRQRGGLGKGWVGMFQSALEMLASASLPQEQYRVLMYLMAKLDFDNYLRITQKQVAEALHMRQPNVSRAIKGLIQFDTIIEGPKIGNARTYRLNPRIAHKGKNPQRTVIEYDELKKRKEKQAHD